MTSRTEKSPVGVVISLSLDQWQSITTLAASRNMGPREWMVEALDDCIGAGMHALPDRVPFPSGQGAMK